MSDVAFFPVTLPIPPGPPLTEEERERYARHLALPGVGELGQRRLRAARVLCLGAGGLGSPVALYLAAAGVGTLGVVDDDVVDESNLQRQVLHTVADVGRRKVDSAADALARLDPAVRVERHAFRLSADEAIDLFARYDVVVDGTDNFATRYLAADAAEITGRPLVWGSVDRFAGQLAVFHTGPGAPADGVGLRDVYPRPPAPGTTRSCAEAGVFGAVVGVLGSMLAGEVVKLCTGVGEPLRGRIVSYDAAGATSRSFRVVPDTGRRRVVDLQEHRRVEAVGACAATVPELGATELARRLAAPEPPLLLDVREPGEWDLCRLPGAVLVPLGVLLGAGVEVLPEGFAPDREFVVYCRSGVRSATAVAELRAAGWAGAQNLRGGILAWADEVDPTVPRY